MTRSPLHKHLKTGDLEWLLMPAILLNQFRLFRAGEQVVGLALWAYLTPEQAAEMGKSGKVKPGRMVPSLTTESINSQQNMNISMRATSLLLIMSRLMMIGSSKAGSCTAPA